MLYVIGQSQTGKYGKTKQSLESKYSRQQKVGYVRHTSLWIEWKVKHNLTQLEKLVTDMIGT